MDGHSYHWPRVCDFRPAEHCCRGRLHHSSQRLGEVEDGKPSLRRFLPDAFPAVARPEALGGVRDGSGGDLLSLVRCRLLPQLLEEGRFGYQASPSTRITCVGAADAASGARNPKRADPDNKESTESRGTG